MGLDHSEALVRVAFDGLIAFCFNKGRTLCEAGLISHSRHHRRISITEILPSGHTQEVPLEVAGKYKIDPTKNLQVSAVNPTPRPGRPAIDEYNDAEPFERVKNLGDAEDFRWVVDLEGGEFHTRKLHPKRDGFKSKLLLTHGVFYTLKKTRLFYGRKITHGPGSGSDPTFLGKLAHNVGVDILCDNVSGKVIVKNEGATDQLELPRALGNTYEILIENSDTPGTTHPSDFPLFYGALDDPGGVKFDLVVAVPRGHPWAKDAEGFANELTFRRDGEPQVCNQGFLRVSETLGA